MLMNAVRQSITRLMLVSLVILPITACSTFKFPGVYRIRVIQGNIIEQEDVNKLKPGMTKRQVQFVMGTPLIRDTFNPDRWDYFYSLRVGKKLIRTKQLTIVFEDDKVVSFEGNIQPKPPEEASQKADTETSELESDSSEASAAG